MTKSLATVKRISGWLDISPSKVNYIIDKLKIQPEKRRGNLRLFNFKQINLIDDEVSRRQDALSAMEVGENFKGNFLGTKNE